MPASRLNFNIEHKYFYRKFELIECIALWDLGGQASAVNDVNLEPFIMIPHAYFPVTVNSVEAQFSYFQDQLRV